MVDTSPAISGIQHFRSAVNRACCSQSRNSGYDRAASAGPRLGKSPSRWRCHRSCWTFQGRIVDMYRE
jgi:hypothetical protein